jgi:hypothetical protein
MADRQQLNIADGGSPVALGQSGVSAGYGGSGGCYHLGYSGDGLCAELRRYLKVAL